MDMVYHLLIEIYPLVPFPPSLCEGVSDYTRKSLRRVTVTSARAVNSSFDRFSKNSKGPQSIIIVVCVTPRESFRLSPRTRCAFAHLLHELRGKPALAALPSLDRRGHGSVVSPAGAQVPASHDRCRLAISHLPRRALDFGEDQLLLARHLGILGCGPAQTRRVDSEKVSHVIAD